MAGPVNHYSKVDVTKLFLHVVHTSGNSQFSPRTLEKSTQTSPEIREHPLIQRHPTEVSYLIVTRGERRALLGEVWKHSFAETVFVG